MKRNAPQRVELDQLPKVTQRLNLICVRCGHMGNYDVGRICYEWDYGKQQPKEFYSFLNYFRCERCDSPGQFEPADRPGLVARLKRAETHEDSGLLRCVTVLFDGTSWQTPAMSEEHLLGLIRKEPDNAFLHCRLGNVLRIGGQNEKADAWYKKAIALDMGDLEAHYQLCESALRARNDQNAVIHLTQLVKYMLEGRVTNKEELTKGLAYYVVDSIFRLEEAFPSHVVDPNGSSNKEDVFIRTLLALEGETQEICEDAVRRLRAGQPMPSSSFAPGTNKPEEASHETSLPAMNYDLAPSLQKLVEDEKLDANKLTLPYLPGDGKETAPKDRHSIPVFDGKKLAYWHVPSLRELFRGDQKPPSDMDHYPEAYHRSFYFIENHLLTLCDVSGDRTDQEMESIYSQLARRPDGKSTGPANDFIWQVSAFLAGTRVLSAAEYESMFRALTTSTRKWGMKPISRNYLCYLRQSFRNK